ncbi:hypothetical protein F4808DRAFT_421464 [Astrocystis sublimbata]|nr:hypothetical protein F4808DRAFT_421464 [Astrocystis sublimbata]
MKPNVLHFFLSFPFLVNAEHHTHSRYLGLELQSNHFKTYPFFVSRLTSARGHNEHSTQVHGKHHFAQGPRCI